MTARLLDAQGAADLLSVPRSWVLAEARADRIPHIRLGTYVRFDPEELIAWARSRRRGPMARLAGHAKVASTTSRAGSADDAPAHGNEGVNFDAG